jgi:hypothetical protein
MIPKQFTLICHSELFWGPGSLKFSSRAANCGLPFDWWERGVGSDAVQLAERLRSMPSFGFAPSGIDSRRHKESPPRIPTHLYSTASPDQIKALRWHNFLLPLNAIMASSEKVTDEDWTFVSPDLKEPQIDKSADNGTFSGETDTASTSSEMRVVDIPGRNNKETR